MREDLHTLYKDLRKEGIILLFSGPVSQSVVEGIGEALRRNMEMDQTSLPVSQRVFSVFVEQMQNILHYSIEAVPKEESPVNQRFGLLVVGKEEERFYVICGNYVDPEEGRLLIETIERLKDMTPEELKRHYKERRRLPSEHSSRGAGLGFIDMARKASLPLEYEFSGGDDRKRFFTIKAVI